MYQSARPGAAAVFAPCLLGCPGTIRQRQVFAGSEISAHLNTVGRPEPDLVTRTSGEQRLSNLLLWQGAYSELYFCEAYWPAFREIDFLRALRSCAARQRKFGA